MNTEHVPTRSEIPESDKWNLTHLFADVGKWQEDFVWLQRTYPQITQWKGKIGASPHKHFLCESNIDRRFY